MEGRWLRAGIAGAGGALCVLGALGPWMVLADPASTRVIRGSDVFEPLVWFLAASGLAGVALAVVGSRPARWGLGLLMGAAAGAAFTATAYIADVVGSNAAYFRSIGTEASMGWGPPLALAGCVMAALASYPVGAPKPVPMLSEPPEDAGPLF